MIIIYRETTLETYPDLKKAALKYHNSRQVFMKVFTSWSQKPEMFYSNLQ